MFRSAQHDTTAGSIDRCSVPPADIEVAWRIWDLDLAEAVLGAGTPDVSKAILLLLGRLLFDVLNDVADGLQFFSIFVWHFDPKFFFKSHHELDDV